MAKIFNYYSSKDSIDYTWYDSSTVKYSKCIDNADALKTLFVVFSNGRQYKYDDVDVNDYLLFREGLSSGKALNQYIKNKSYEYTKCEDANVEQLDDELEFRKNNGILFVLEDKENGRVQMTLTNNRDEEIYSKEVDIPTYETIREVVEALGHPTKSKHQDWYGNYC